MNSMANHSSARIAFILLASLMAASCIESHGIDGLRAKLRNRFGLHSGAASGANVGAFGAGAASGAAAAAGGYGSGYGSGYGASSASAAATAGARSSAAAAAAAGAGLAAPAARRQSYVAGGGYGAAAAGSAAGYGAASSGASASGFGAANEFEYDDDVDFGSAAAASSASANVYAQPPPAPTPVVRRPVVRKPVVVSAPAPLPPLPPVKPVASVNQFKVHNNALNGNRFRYGAGGAAAAASSAAGAGYGGAAAASSAAAVAGNGQSNQYVNYGVADNAPASVTASAVGTFSSDDNGRESSSYKRTTENVENHEDGRADDNHYYNAQSYGKTDDENLHEAFNKNDEDVEQTPTVYRSKKSGENYVMDYNKARRESGSGVLAKDKHSSAFNKNYKKFNEHVDQASDRQGAGFAENVSSVTTQNFDDADEEIYDSDGFDQSGAAAAASAASVAGRGAAAASSAAAGRH